ncbi:RNA polymerase sigma factor RpoD/SigA [Alloprevotella tannerae]|jgi:RNA polymerase sigma factor, sigma-70 family|uniref:sigma-70 family RNA polymerase sigma factor n=1 Tax=Alloprevotella tannerae TaxID=76122 RepID=UPI001EDA503D|nr:RNA polymerase sigma factor RpoD/SigA [Alloprevotella tannerae]MCG2652205.1 RNA polymerase sigma factor RpoD/SigA [Alloprevotella tannerae]
MRRQIKIRPAITNRNNESLERYLSEISREPRITVEEEVELGRRAKNGDEAAVERLVRANLRFVVSVAKQYQGQGISLIDLINEGNLGLIQAAHRFDDTRGFKFISYAVWWIRQSILLAITEKSRLIRLPQNQMSSIQKILRFYNQYMQDYERPPSIEEICEQMQVTEERVRLALQLQNKPLSIDAPLTEDEARTLSERLRSDKGSSADGPLLKEAERWKVKRMLNLLPPLERSVIEYYLGFKGQSISLEEIGNRIGLSRERVRQIKVKAIMILRRHHESTKRE